MKQIILVLAALTSFQFAHADNNSLLIRCSPAQKRPDVGVGAELFINYRTNALTLQVTSRMLGHVNKEEYAVKELLPPRRRLGAPVVYKGRGVRLTVRNTAPRPDGGRPASLERAGRSTEELSCRHYR